MAPLVLVLAAALGCRREPPRPPAPPPPDPNAVQPVYPIVDGPPEPLVQRLCEALQTSPSKRRAECCGVPAPPSAADECVKVLGAALRAKAVTLITDDVESCVAAMGRAIDGCDWIGPTPLGPPPECGQLVHGNLPARTRCRSSLECQGTLRCQGLTDKEPGVCGAPLDGGSSCGMAADPLATLLREEPLEEVHPECNGHCERHRCTAPISPGGRCTASVQCPIGYRCARERCMQGLFAKVGEACTAACEWGSRCIKGRCVAPSPEGAPCDGDLECKGACVKKDGKGVCGKACERRDGGVAPR